MLKSAKYFFFIFVITTVIPLLAMFFWMNAKIDVERESHAQNFSQIGKKEFQSVLDGYLERQEGRVLQGLRDVDFDQMPLLHLQKKLGADSLEFVKGVSSDQVVSYYELKKIASGELRFFSTVVVPVGNKTLKISQALDFRDLNYFAPFNIELYVGNEISQKTFLQRVSFPPHRQPMRAKTPPHLLYKHDFIYQKKSPIFSKVPILDKNGGVIATFVIEPLKMPRPPESRFFENDFGLIILFAGSILSFLMAFYIQKNFIKPLMQLSDASKQVQKGVFDVCIKTDVKHDEIQRTFLNFNQMCSDLKEKEELRNSFIVNLTHDLRTPLIAQERSLSMFAKCFEKLGLKDEEELSQSLEKNNQHLLRMVNLILESYRFDVQKVKLFYTDVDISDLVEGTFEKLKSLAMDKKIVLENLVPQDFEAIRADETSLKRIFVNLVSNSIENLSDGGIVKISAEQDGDFVQIFVEDNGCGISPDEIAHIFERYYSGKSLERKLGSGLGLDVCKKLVDLHKGTISVESEANIYTKFTIKLPIKEQV